MSGRDGYAGASTAATMARAWFVRRYAADRIDEPSVPMWMRSPLDDKGIVIDLPPVFMEWLAAVGPPRGSDAEVEEQEAFARSVLKAIAEIHKDVGTMRPLLVGTRDRGSVFERLRFLTAASGARRRDMRSWARRRLGAERVRVAFVSLEESVDILATAWAAVAPVVPSPRRRGHDPTDEGVWSDTRLVRAFVQHVTKTKDVKPAPAALAAIALERDPPCAKAGDFTGRREKWEERLSRGG